MSEPTDPQRQWRAPQMTTSAALFPPQPSHSLPHADDVGNAIASYFGVDVHDIPRAFDLPVPPRSFPAVQTEEGVTQAIADYFGVDEDEDE